MLNSWEHVDIELLLLVLLELEIFATTVHNLDNLLILNHVELVSHGVAVMEQEGHCKSHQGSEEEQLSDQRMLRLSVVAPDEQLSANHGQSEVGDEHFVAWNLFYVRGHWDDVAGSGVGEG